jgi:hypothetical protein
MWLSCDTRLSPTVAAAHESNWCIAMPKRCVIMTCCILYAPNVLDVSDPSPPGGNETNFGQLPLDNNYLQVHFPQFWDRICFPRAKFCDLYLEIIFKCSIVRVANISVCHVKCSAPPPPTPRNLDRFLIKYRPSILDPLLYLAMCMCLAPILWWVFLYNKNRQGRLQTTWSWTWWPLKRTNPGD